MSWHIHVMLIFGSHALCTKCLTIPGGNGSGRDAGVCGIKKAKAAEAKSWLSQQQRYPHPPRPLARCSVCIINFHSLTSADFESSPNVTFIQEENLYLLFNFIILSSLPNPYSILQ